MELHRAAGPHNEQVFTGQLCSPIMHIRPMQALMYMELCCVSQYRPQPATKNTVCLLPGGHLLHTISKHTCSTCNHTHVHLHSYKHALSMHLQTTNHFLGVIILQEVLDAELQGVDLRGESGALLQVLWNREYRSVCLSCTAPTKQFPFKLRGENLTTRFKGEKNNRHCNIMDILEAHFTTAKDL